MLGVVKTANRVLGKWSFRLQDPFMVEHTCAALVVLYILDDTFMFIVITMLLGFVFTTLT